MTMLADKLPQRDNAYLNWTHITPVDRIKTLPPSKDALCEDAVGAEITLEVAEYIATTEWEFAAGRKSRGAAVRFKSSRSPDGKSPPLVLTSQKNAWAIMAILGADESQWIGKKIKLCVSKDRSPRGGFCNCIRFKDAK